MVPLHYAQHPQFHSAPQLASINTHQTPSSLAKNSRDIRRVRQHPVQMELLAQAVAQVDLPQERVERCPVVWRWVPSTATGCPSEPSSLSASSSNPRVIYATATRVDSGSNAITNNNESERSPHLLTRGELREARQVLVRNKTKESAPTFAAPPTTQAPLTNKVHQDGGKDLEAASLLLHMGGTSSDSNSDAEEKETSSTKKRKSPEDQPTKNAKSKPSTSESPKLQDEYLTKWVAGSVSLHTPEDDDVLSPLHCFMRRYCVEAFSATAEDVATPRYGKSHGYKVEIGQVGIRCMHCKNCEPRLRAERSICYPSSLRNIYHSIETWQRRHSLVCKHITPWVRNSIMKLMESSKSRAGGRRQYWEDSARRLGMVDTSRGVRFSRKPGDLDPIPPKLGYRMAGDPEAAAFKPEPVVREEDRDLVTDYLFLLMEQMQTCRFTEADRIGGRSKIKDNEVGFPGMECRHCQGRAGFGRYFPSSVGALSLANSDRNVYNHLLKCRRCPENIKTELVQLQKNQTQSKNRRGLRKLFFNRIWDRIHKDGKNPEAKKKEAKKAPRMPAVSIQQRNLPTGYVPHTSIHKTIQQIPQMPQMPQIPPSYMAHPYHGNIQPPHPSVVVNNFRSF